MREPPPLGYVDNERVAQHLLSLPLFIPLRADIGQGFSSLVRRPAANEGQRITAAYLVLFSNLTTQCIYVSNVNRLTSVSRVPRMS
jgi:hypothetical protein